MKMHNRQKRLAARIRNWESQPKFNVAGHVRHKPGSLKNEVTMNLETDLTRKGLTKCECPLCNCQTAVVTQIQDSICFECRKLEHPTTLKLEEAT